jgi:hypothetical protein
MYTEDDLGRELRTGAMTVDQVVTLFQGDEVVVYPPVGVAEGTEMWADVEDMGAGSTIFADLTKAGATPEQMDDIGTNIERLRATGRTLDKVYGWSPEAMTPEGTAAPATLTPVEDEAGAPAEGEQPV